MFDVQQIIGHLGTSRTRHHRVNVPPQSRSQATPESSHASPPPPTLRPCQRLSSLTGEDGDDARAAAVASSAAASLEAVSSASASTAQTASSYRRAMRRRATRSFTVPPSASRRNDRSTSCRHGHLAQRQLPFACFSHELLGAGSVLLGAALNFALQPVYSFVRTRDRR